jgi:glycosyltransferase involved in cell wall biosynthesis
VPTTLFLVENAPVPRDSRVWAECRTMRAHGWDVVVVCPGQPDDHAAVAEIEGVKIVRFEAAEGSGNAFGYLSEYLRAFHRMMSVVRDLSRHHRFDVVHAANPPDFLLATALGPRRRGAAAIFDHHDLSPELFESKFARRGAAHRGLLAAERAGFALADVVISTNESFRSIAIERGKKHPSDVFVVRNGPDPSIFRPVPPSPELRRGAPYLVGFAGLMGTQDGITEAIQALAVLRQRRSDWHAVFAGDGEMLTHARELATELGLSEVVEFVGFVGDRERLVRLLASCDVCISPEPMNQLNDHSTLIKVAEYMALGKPIVAFDLGETRFTASDAAIYVRSVAAFAEAIDELLDDGERRERMGRLGRERVLSSLSWAQSEENLLAAYDRAIHRASTRRTRGNVRVA